MYRILGLFLLISLLGCNQGPSNRMAFGDGSLASLAQNQELDVEETPDVQDDDEGESPLIDSEVEETQAEVQEASQGMIGPDSLIPEPAEAMSLKSSSEKVRVYLSCYGGAGVDRYSGQYWCPQYVRNKPEIQAWANRKGLTSSEANAEGYRYATVRFVDIFRDKPTRDLSYGGQAMYPTYVMTDQHGHELWHHVGYLEPGYLDAQWNLANHVRRRRSQGLLDNLEASTHPDDNAQASVAVGAGISYQCGPNGCRIVRNRRLF